ncbi:PP2C family protein-serine/threonine phosphatase [Mesorhizobium sp. 1B3]|uniref:PP2C family protein-serine/threonine phosphatase n=1 Tax=Mesorhizobium sp. 1B3 TaxID=3243599 RepID=UPI003D99247E
MSEHVNEDAVHLRAEIARLQAELDDLRLLNDALMEHGEAVEDQLAQQNLQLEQTQQRLDAELADAARYLFSILPEKRDTLPKTDWLLVPSTELGGDSFGYRRIDDDHFACYLIDVCGHGVGAALLSVAVINVLRSSALVNADFREPSEVLAALNDMFPMERQSNMFFTIWYGVYNATSGKLRYASGGHPPAIHLRQKADGPTEPTLLITMGGMAIGAFPDIAFESASLTMEPGDRLLLLSDGTFEVDRRDGEMLTVDELAAFAAGTSDRPQAIHDWVCSFGDGGPLPDDFTLLRIEF